MIAVTRSRVGIVRKGFSFSVIAQKCVRFQKEHIDRICRVESPLQLLSIFSIRNLNRFRVINEKLKPCKLQTHRDHRYDYVREASERERKMLVGAQPSLEQKQKGKVQHFCWNIF